MKSTTPLHLFIIINFIGICTSCKKNKDNTTPAPPIDTSAIATKVKDSAVLITRDFYIWYTQIPSTFSTQSYADPKAVMEGLRAYSIEPGFSGPVDKWSFGVLKSDWNQLSGGFGSVNNTASNGDFGLSVFFKDSSKNDLRVKLVERLSPAGIAGIQRGWRITKINGNTNITTAPANVTFIVNNVYYSTSSTFTFT